MQTTQQATSSNDGDQESKPKSYFKRLAEACKKHGFINSHLPLEPRSTGKR